MRRDHQYGEAAMSDRNTAAESFWHTVRLLWHMTRLRSRTRVERQRQILQQKKGSRVWGVWLDFAQCGEDSRASGDRAGGEQTRCERGVPQEAER